jgi:hypothetical protein
MVPDLGHLDTAPTVYPSRVPAAEAKLVFYEARPLRMQVMDDILPQPKIGKTERSRPSPRISVRLESAHYHPKGQFIARPAVADL